MAAAITSVVVVDVGKTYMQETKEQGAKAQAKQAMEYNDALQAYLDENYEALKSSPGFDVGAGLLKQLGKLPSYFPESNRYGEAYLTHVTPVTTPSGKIILQGVTGIGSSKMSGDMNRYLALATGSPLAGVTMDGKMYGNNGTYTIDSIRDFKRYGDAHIMTNSGGNAMNDIKLAPAYSSVEAYTPNNAGLEGPVNFPPPPPPPAPSGDSGGGGGNIVGCGDAVGEGWICISDTGLMVHISTGGDAATLDAYARIDSRGTQVLDSNTFNAAQAAYDPSVAPVYDAARTGGSAGQAQ